MVRPELRKTKRPMHTPNKGNRIEKPVTRHLTRNQTAKLNAITVNNERGSPLLRLPQEINDMVYGYAIGGGKIRRPKLEHQNSLFNLSRVSRTLYLETNPLPYKLNEFPRAPGDLFDAMINNLDDEKRGAINYMSLDSCTRSLIAKLPNMDKLPNLGLIIIDRLEERHLSSIEEYARRRELKLNYEGQQIIHVLLCSEGKSEEESGED
ncbi:hypothetical protein EJ02DRAFT_430893 [Clathrospora elynae]|uniref:Uncharacterized protein n=1 Tax=Clathrospora elynae TaxID=706981 RepID=A0A6A5T229_9PLEO|nr:hypothetical protein EJ02DRAFT_430893 [Clathrospora elynae]